MTCFPAICRRICARARAATAPSSPCRCSAATRWSACWSASIPQRPRRPRRWAARCCWRSRRCSRPGHRPRQRAGAAAGRGAVGHRRPDAAVEFPLPQPGAAPGDQAGHAQQTAAVDAVPRPGRLQEVNDNHGHLAGSKALVEAGAVIRDCARETDVVARFGGDEFALILPDTGPEGAMAVAGASGSGCGLIHSSGRTAFPSA